MGGASSRKENTGDTGAVVWRVSRLGRLGAVGAFVLWFLISVLLLSDSNAVGGGVIMLSFSFFVILPGVWLWAFFPSVVLTDSELVVRNRGFESRIPLVEIDDVRPGYYGLFIKKKDGEEIRGWAVQKSNFKSLFHKRSRSDEVCAAILARAAENSLV